MATYNFADVTVTGAFPYQLMGIASLAAFAYAYSSKGKTRVYALGAGIVTGLIFLASVPKAGIPDTGGILDYNANLSP